MTTQIKIKRAGAGIRRYRCNRCGVVLQAPVENTSLYIWDGENALLIDPGCLKETDGYIWGDETYLQKEEGIEK